MTEMTWHTCTDDFIGNAFQTKQGNRTSCRHQEGRRGSAEAVLGTSMFSSSETGVSGSPPLALFVVMLSKAHLTSHSRMSGTRETPQKIIGELTLGRCANPWATHQYWSVAYEEPGCTVGGGYLASEPHPDPQQNTSSDEGDKPCLINCEL